MSSPTGKGHAINTPRQVLFASLIGTTIEFFDFFIYGTAAVLVFPRLFFPASDPASATLASLATFAIAFVARPIGAAIFGHFGDRVGRKTTLVASLLTMGLSTVAIGLLPTHQSIGLAAPLLLALCRFGQGLGLGGEWGGAVLLATENAPPERRVWYGMFPQFGPSVGFFFSGAIFIALSRGLSDAQFFSWGWRVPFIASAALLVVGLYVRLSITETPVFREAMARQARVRVPMAAVVRDHAWTLLLGTLIALSAFLGFYLLAVFGLSWATRALGYTRDQFLFIQLFSVLFFAATIPSAARLAEHGRRRMLIAANVASVLYGLVFGWLFESGTIGATVAMVAGMALNGYIYAPLSTVLAELFPTAVRYTGSSMCYNLAGIFGASLAPYAATWLATDFGLAWVGYYLSAVSGLSIVGLLLSEETRGRAL